MAGRRRRIDIRSAATLFVAILLVFGTGAWGSGGYARADDCAAVEMVAVRGTHEPGNLGAVVGDPLYAALAAAVPLSVGAYAVRYPADLLDPGSVSRGTGDLVDHLVDRSVRCPAQRYVVAGYSQGAVVVHGALGTGVMVAMPGIRQLPPALAPRIAAVLLFGDPLRLNAWSVADVYASRTRSYCAPGDPICQLGATDPDAHVGYRDTIAAAADFAAHLL
ncbi:cutinase family protein [Nocardia cyriacigeorgica]|uniref:cutinase family protein n=1 Tax=Nocardia cyriacigeorgica TaxID=135487 RepID=UPI002456B09E|nr:cutinase family protein [Nocardia cyriacigeorgica]